MSSVQSSRGLCDEPFASLRDVLGRVSTRPASGSGGLLPDCGVLPHPADTRPKRTEPEATQVRTTRPARSQRA